MECRDARPLIASLDVLPRSDREHLDVHLRTCAACRDEVDDPLVAQSLGLALPLAMPPHSLVQEVLLRLPAASPVEIAAREQRARGVVRGIMIATFGLLGALGLVGFILLQFTALRAADLVRGVALPLALAAKALLAVVGQPWITLVLLAATLIIPALLPRLMGGATGRRISLARPAQLGGALVALLLLGHTVTHPGNISTVTAPIGVTGRVAGSVTSVTGDISLRGEVLGDVTALAGRVLLYEGAHVYGSVLSGAGVVSQPGARVDQVMLGENGPLPALAQVTGAGRVAGVSPYAAAGIAGMLAALATLVLAVVLVVAWPQPAMEASAYLARYPGRALMLGGLASVALLAVALSGSVLLAATVAGVLFVPALLLLLHLPYVAGVAAVGQALGRVLTGRPSITGAIWGIAAQVIVIILLGMLLPAAGLLIFYLLGSAGLGGALLVQSSDGLET